MAALGIYATAASAQPTIGGAVQNQIDSQIDSTLTDSVQQSVHSQVQSTVDSQVQSNVDSQVQSTVDSQVQTNVDSQVQSTVDSQVQSTVEQQVESGVTDAVQSQVDAGVVGAVEQHLESGISGTVDDALGALTSARTGSESGRGDSRSGGSHADSGAGGRSRHGGRSANVQPDRKGRFVAAVDAAGRTIERNVWLVLVPSKYADRIKSWGFDIEQRRALPALDRVLLRVSAPADRSLAQVALQLAADAPGTRVDFNHVYRPERGVRVGGEGGSRALRAAPPAAGLDVGIVDGAVDVNHPALRGARIVRKDFVRGAAARPLDHGTAVASILVGASGRVHGRLPGATLYAACVFFRDDAGGVIATTQSLVEALAWLDAEHVPVINMSLAGPPNAVLKSAVDLVARHGKIVVAAVGNDGPTAPPDYPAAYRSVVGVTAVDAEDRIYAYANRGPQVMFSAPGVGVRVALGRGSYGTQTGTSMAAPYAAALIVRALAHGRSAKQALRALQASALDLGAKNFDDVYGFGLIVDPDRGS